MDVISGLSALFFSIVDNVCSGAFYLVCLLVAAWGAAFIFNLIHELSGWR